MTEMLTPAFLRKLDKLDHAGLEALRKELVVRQEGARMRFAKDRSPKNGEAYRRRGFELGEVRSRLRAIAPSA